RVEHQTTGVVPIVANLTAGPFVPADMLVSEQAVVRHGHRLPRWHPLANPVVTESKGQAPSAQAVASRCAGDGTEKLILDSLDLLAPSRRPDHFVVASSSLSSGIQGPNRPRTHLRPSKAL